MIDDDHDDDIASLTSVLDLSLARTIVIRDVDATVASHHGLGMNDLALLLELADAPGGACASTTWTRDRSSTWS